MFTALPPSSKSRQEDLQETRCSGLHPTWAEQTLFLHSEENTVEGAGHMTELEHEEGLQLRTLGPLHQYAPTPPPQLPPADLLPAPLCDFAPGKTSLVSGSSL